MYLHCHGFSRHASFGSFFHRETHFIGYLWSASLHICDFHFLLKKWRKMFEKRAKTKKTKQKYHNLLLLTFFSKHFALNS